MEPMVHGATLLGFARACPNLEVVAGPRTLRLTEGVDAHSWYPMERLCALEAVVLRNYQDAESILERAGMEMMSGWYHHGPGRELIASGIDFLTIQRGSKGYRHLVRGPESQVGTFALLQFNLSERTAAIGSTTPFNKHLERGVIIGGMSAPGDLDLVQVDNSRDPRFFHVSF